MNAAIIALFLAGTGTVPVQLPDPVVAMCEAEGGCVMLSKAALEALVNELKSEKVCWRDG